MKAVGNSGITTAAKAHLSSIEYHPLYNKKKTNTMGGAQ